MLEQDKNVSNKFLCLQNGALYGWSYQGSKKKKKVLEVGVELVKDGHWRISNVC